MYASLSIGNPAVICKKAYASTSIYNYSLTYILVFSDDTYVQMLTVTIFFTYIMFSATVLICCKLRYDGNVLFNDVLRNLAYGFMFMWK